MIHQSDYPPIGSLKGDDSPFEILQKIEEYPNLSERLENDAVIIENYEKSFFINRKVLEVTFYKIVNADEETKSFDKDSNGKIFGFVVIQKRSEIYRALYDEGVLLSNVAYMQKVWSDKGLEYLMMNDINMSKFCSRKIQVLNSLEKFSGSISKLFIQNKLR